MKQQNCHTVRPQPHFLERMCLLDQVLWQILRLQSLGAIVHSTRVSKWDQTMWLRPNAGPLVVIICWLSSWWSQDHKHRFRSCPVTWNPNFMLNGPKCVNYKEENESHLAQTHSNSELTFTVSSSVRRSSWCLESFVTTAKLQGSLAWCQQTRLGNEKGCPCQVLLPWWWSQECITSQGLASNYIINGSLVGNCTSFWVAEWDCCSS